MDLQEQLAGAITDNTGLLIKVAYLAPDSDLGLVPTQGSHVVEEDYSGLQTWLYNYEITIKTQDAEDAKEKLFKISQYLNGLTDLKSKEDSFEFLSLDVNSAPSEVLLDDKGAVFYALDIAVTVDIDKNK